MSVFEELQKKNPRSIALKIALWKSKQSQMDNYTNVVELTEKEAQMLYQELQMFFWYKDNPVTLEQIYNGEIRFYNAQIKVLRNEC
jgi:hypothetical protein|tara:strand:- start:716 stop:973 length:258 start_codon:yes stop_codon:yes gene_type:complete